MATITIYVSQNGNSKTLKLSDSEGHEPGNDKLITDADAADTIEWKLKTNATHPIASIESISYSAPQEGPPPKYQNSIEVLTSNPSLVENVWTGYVKNPSPGINKTEYYQIGFKLPGDSKTYYDDPQIKMRN